jgi:hypothetical protein
MVRFCSIFLVSLSLTAFSQNPAQQRTSDVIPAQVNLDPSSAPPPPRIADTIPAQVNLAPTPPVINVSTSDLPAAAAGAGSTPRIYDNRGFVTYGTPTVGSGVPGTSGFVPLITTPQILSGPDVPAARGGTSVTEQQSQQRRPALVTGARTVEAASLNPSAKPTMTIADAAVRARATKGQRKSRSFDNDAIMALNNVNPGLRSADEQSMPQSDTSGQASGPQAPQPQAENRLGVASAERAIDPAELARVEAALARSRDNAQSQVASNQQGAEVTAESASGQTATQPPAQPQTSQQQPGGQSEAAAADGTEGSRLPDSASWLPVVTLFGLLAFAVGGIGSFVLRNRRS